MADTAPVLVTGATGKQGGAVARALLQAGTPVRALVRDPDSEPARALAAAGVELVRGDLTAPDTLTAAVAGARGVFSVQLPNIMDLTSDSEVRSARNLVEAAKAAGVPQFVHTSAAGTGDFDLDGFDVERWGEGFKHLTSMKVQAEEVVRTAGFPSWTILRPATFMENFIRPSIYFVDFVSDRLAIVTDPDLEWPFVAVDDIGAAAAAAFADPARFDGVELELASQMLTYRQVAALLSSAWGADIEAPNLTVQEAIDAGVLEPFIQLQDYMKSHPLSARPEMAHALGIQTRSFEGWTKEHPTG